MAIKKASELSFTTDKLAVLIAARPGTGKTTLAFSAPKALLIDLEAGVKRVDACYRKDVMEPEDKSISNEEKYHSFIKDLEEADLSDYDTLIIDTLGKLFELMTPVVIKESSQNAQKDGRTLSQKGYGALANKAKDFISLCKSKGKHVIFISHVDEKIDQDGKVKIRLNIPGQTKNTIWNDLDLAGHIEIVGGKRYITFGPTESFDGKGGHSIKGVYQIPELKSSNEGGNEKDNYFLEGIFNEYFKNLEEENKVYNEAKAKYDKIMLLAEDVKKATNAEELNAAVEKIKKVEHVLTSRKELLAHVGVQANHLKLEYDTKAGCYKAIA